MFTSGIHGKREVEIEQGLCFVRVSTGCTHEGGIVDLEIVSGNESEGTWR